MGLKLLLTTVVFFVFSGCAAVRPNNVVDYDLPYHLYGGVVVNFLKNEYSLKYLSYSTNVPGIVIDLSSGMPIKEEAVEWQAYALGVKKGLDSANLNEKALKQIAVKLNNIENTERQTFNLCRSQRKQQTSYYGQFKEKVSHDILDLVEVKNITGFSGIVSSFEVKDNIDLNIKLHDTKIGSSEAYFKDCPSIEPFVIGVAPASTLMSRLKKKQKSASIKLRKFESNSDDFLAGLRGSGVAKIKCNDGKMEEESDLVFRSDCPSEIQVRENNLINARPLKFYIVAKNFYDVMPAFYDNEDSNLKISLVNDQISVTNRSDQYLTVQKMSLYYNDKIITIGQGLLSIADLPPAASATVPLEKFDMRSLDNDFLYITAKKIRQERVLFGLSARYSTTNDTRGFTLHEPKYYQLNSIIPLPGS